MITDSTASELRETGISVVGGVRWGTHFCSFYETKEDLLETLVLYFKAGLENKEFCLWVVSQTLSVEEAQHALGQAVPDVERYLAEGALEIHTHDEWYRRDGRWDPQQVLQSWSEKLNPMVRKGYAGSRGAGDGGWIQNEDHMVFREYEKEVNRVIADQRSIILCTYPLTTSPGDQVFDLAHIHQVAAARRNGNWEIMETPRFKEAKAEIKRLYEELELKVEERTRELAFTNKALTLEIDQRKQTEETLERYTHLLQSFSRRLFEVQEDERRHLARELHDEIGQTLTAAKINTDMLRATIPIHLAARLNENAAILDRLIQQTRQISLDLRPPLLDDLGLVPALRWYVSQQAERAGLETRFSADALADAVAPHIQIACFRLAQEAVTNVVRHARARTLTVEVSRAGTALRLMVRDDGKGFDVTAAEARAEQGASLGLVGLKERAALAGGSANITSSLGSGATVEILLPADVAESANVSQGTSLS